MTRQITLHGKTYLIDTAAEDGAPIVSTRVNAMMVRPVRAAEAAKVLDGLTLKVVGNG